MCQFSDKTDNFDFLGPNLPKNGFWGRIFKNLSLDSESASPRYSVSQFSVKMDNFETFGLNVGKLPNYVRYFGSNIVEGVAGWGLKWAGWRWMEVGARFSNAQSKHINRKGSNFDLQELVKVQKDYEKNSI